MFRALLGMPLIHKTLINIFLQKLPILQAQFVFYSAKTANARGCINRAILEEKYLSKFYDVFWSWESTWSNKWVCEGCNTADIFKIFKRQILTALWSLEIMEEISKLLWAKLLFFLLPFRLFFSQISILVLTYPLPTIAYLAAILLLSILVCRSIPAQCSKK